MNSSFKTSLHCFKNPFTVISILILLLNDHLFKSLYPSLITGKLSNFAGLFFFPFLLTLILSVLQKIFKNISTVFIGQLAIGITVLWFTLLKVTTFGNYWTNHFMSLILGYPVNNLIDPTDLIALVILIPSWKLWVIESYKIHTHQKPVWISYFIIFLSASASLATKPVQSSAEFVIHNGNIYTKQKNYPVKSFISRDFGRSWNKIDFADKQKIPWKYPENSEVIRHHPTQKKIIYEIKRDEKVYISKDSEKSWQVDWEIPPGRRSIISENYVYLAFYHSIFKVGNYYGLNDMILIWQKEF